jgi:hypothetical protein
MDLGSGSVKYTQMSQVPEASHLNTLSGLGLTTRKTMQIQLWSAERMVKLPLSVIMGERKLVAAAALENALRSRNVNPTANELGCDRITASCSARGPSRNRGALWT